MKPVPAPNELKAIASRLRQQVVKMLAQSKTGHAAGALGMADVFTALYFGGVVKHDPHRPDWPGRDRVILSNGHINPILYASLAEAGYFDPRHLLTLRQFGSPLQGHPHLGAVPGVENTSGSLGQGLSQAVGLALAWRINQEPNHVFALLSDGEHQEGQTWEAYMLAAAKKLDNLTVLVDRNKIQIDGFTNQVMPLEPLKNKIASFGWQVLEIDGHDIEAIINACWRTRAVPGKPTALICRTTPGKGVSFMENDPHWHGQTPNAEQAQQALEELSRGN